MSLLSKLSFKGIFYSNAYIYEQVTRLKLKQDKDLRYRIAAKYVNADDAVLDICAGTGRFRRFIPPTCGYTAIESSDNFVKRLNKMHVPCIQHNLHCNVELTTKKFDILVIIISLYQFRATSVDKLLTEFKTIAKKVIIVEEVMTKMVSVRPFWNKVMNHLCGASFYLNTELYTDSEFNSMMAKHHYDVEKVTDIYRVGVSHD